MRLLYRGLNLETKCLFMTAISSLLKGCLNLIEKACKANRPLSFSLYFKSPTMGCPSSDKWTRIWFFLPVKRSISNILRPLYRSLILNLFFGQIVINFWPQTWQKHYFMAEVGLNLKIECPICLWNWYNTLKIQCLIAHS